MSINRIMGERSYRADGARDQGFTVIALLVLIMIVGGIGGITTFMVGNLASRASCATEKETVVEAQESYKAATGRDPTSMDSLDGRAPAPSNIAELLTSPPPDYTVDGRGNVIAITNNPHGCA
jgi:hypothetical protein